MYASHFGLAGEPFSIAPDPRFLFMSERHREALAHLLYGIRGGGGFVLLTGAVGAGKTTVCRCFLEQVPAHCVVAYVFNPKLSVPELLQTVCAEFGIAAPAERDSVKAHVDVLNRFLLDAHAQGRQALLVIDEAQSLSAEVLEQLRLLTNLETAERKLLQIVLIGQPELREQLAQPGLEQLAQRVIARYHLGPLSFGETRQYIAHRLSVAGLRGAMPFDAAAERAIHRLTRGVPRRINLLADRALLGAYAQGLQRVGRSTVEKAAREVFDRARGRRPSWWAWGAGAVLLLAAAAGAPWWLQQREAPPRPLTDDRTSRARPPAASAAESAVTPASAASLASAASAAVAAVPTMAASGSSAARAVPADPKSLLAAARTDPDTAWRELALRWNVAIGEGEPCKVAAMANLACFSSRTGGLASVRLLGRPVVITLREATDAPRYVLLVALDADRATLVAAGETFSLGLADLVQLWRGEFATLWRTRPGWRDDKEPGAEARAWIDRQIRSVQPALVAASPRQRIQAFQLLQGLPPDGVAGPMTLMLLNRAASVDEPKLLSTATIR